MHDMTAKELADVETQTIDGNDSTEAFEKTDSLTDDWDAPYNLENPRNWSACEGYTIYSTIRKQC